MTKMYYLSTWSTTYWGSCKEEEAKMEGIKRKEDKKSKRERKEIAICEYSHNVVKC